MRVNERFQEREMAAWEGRLEGSWKVPMKINAPELTIRTSRFPMARVRLMKLGGGNGQGSLGLNAEINHGKHYHTCTVNDGKPKAGVVCNGWTCFVSVIQYQ